MTGRKTDTKLKRVTISVEPVTYERMESLAHKTDLSTAWLIRKAMQEFLDKWEGKEQVVIPTLRQGK